jgi:hypothetical protein
MTDLQKIEPATFIGQTRTRLVRARSKWKVNNTWANSCEDPQYQLWIEEREPDRVLTPLEQMYRDFCKSAHNYLVMHPSLQGEYHPHRIIFPDFYYEIIPAKFPVE